MRLIGKVRCGNKTIFYFLGIKFKYKNKADSLLTDCLKQWETDYNPKKLEQDIENLINTAEANKEYNREIYLIYISTLYENGKLDKAKQYLRQYLNKYECVDIYCFPLVCKLAVKIGIKDKQVIQITEIFDKLEKVRKDKILEQFLTNKNIAIVGNSPNLKNKNKGRDIDKFDCVIRFNNYKIDGYEQDYGSKTTIWICCQADDIQNKTLDELKKLSHIVYNVDLKHTKLREKCRNNIIKNLESNIPISYIGSEYKKDLKGYSIEYPSSGLSGIYHINALQKLTRKNIFGFSFLDESTNCYEHYFAQRSKRKIRKFLKNCHHNFEKENIFLKAFFNS